MKPNLKLLSSSLVLYLFLSLAGYIFTHDLTFALILGLVIFATIIIHELGHLEVYRSFGITGKLIITGQHFSAGVEVEKSIYQKLNGGQIQRVLLAGTIFTLPILFLTWLWAYQQGSRLSLIVFTLLHLVMVTNLLPHDISDGARFHNILRKDRSFHWPVWLTVFTLYLLGSMVSGNLLGLVTVTVLFILSLFTSRLDPFVDAFRHQVFNRRQTIVFETLYYTIIAACFVLYYSLFIN